MKKLTIFFTLLMFLGSSTAQDNIPSFGKIDKATLEMKDCEFNVANIMQNHCFGAGIKITVFHFQCGLINFTKRGNIVLCR